MPCPLNRLNNILQWHNAHLTEVEAEDRLSCCAYDRQARQQTFARSQQPLFRCSSLWRKGIVFFRLGRGLLLLELLHSSLFMAGPSHSIARNIWIVKCSCPRALVQPQSNVTHITPTPTRREFPKQCFCRFWGSTGKVYREVIVGE